MFFLCNEYCKNSNKPTTIREYTTDVNIAYGATISLQKGV